MALISKKKPVIPVSPHLRKYLLENNREVAVGISYKDLFHYNSAIALMDSSGQDTLWETVLYSPSDRQEIHDCLKKIYAYMKADGDLSVMEHLYVDRVDVCIHGNTKPFRVRIVNRINDLFDYFYVKDADASRIYGLELEHLLSPNKINYLVIKNTLIEEHIPGITGSQFIQTYLKDPKLNVKRLAKEFIKFNERCLVQLLGDMHADNYVVEIIPDFDETYYRLRAIDFDQTCYDGRRAIYLPQYFKENNPIIVSGMRNLNHDLEVQYVKEERSRIATRIKATYGQLQSLIKAMSHDPISTEEKVDHLKYELAEFYQDNTFITAHNMGEILWTSLRMVVMKPIRKNYHHQAIGA
jgi:hypothetical protein